MAMTTDGEKNMFEEFDKRGNANWMGPGAPVNGMSRLARLRMRECIQFFHSMQPFLR